MASASESAPAHCTHCADGTPHEQFVSLLFDSRLAPAELMSNATPPASSSWDYSRQPLVNLSCHRRLRRFRIGPKATKHLAPHIQHALIIGPFLGGASLFVRLMKDRCRRWKQKLAGSVLLARKWHRLDKARQQGTRVHVYQPDIQGHKEMLASVLDVRMAETERQALLQAARALIQETAST